MDSTTSARDFINGLVPTARETARLLATSGAVKILFAQKQSVEGTIQKGVAEYRLKLRHDGRSWLYHITPGTNEGPTLAASLLIGAFPEAMPEVSMEAPIEDAGGRFLSLVLDKLGRPLESDEQAYWQRLARRWEQYSREGEIYDHDLVRLHPRWPVAGTDPLHLWPEPPTDLQSFWNLIAWHMERKRLTPPAFLLPATNTQWASAVMADWQRRQSVNRWKQSFHTQRQVNVPPTWRELRIVATPQDARLQSRDSHSSNPWSYLDSAILGITRQAWERGDILFPPESEFLWQSWWRWAGGQSEAKLSLADESVATGLGRFWLQIRNTSLCPLWHTLDEAPFQTGPTLRWTIDEKNNPDGKTRDYLFSLADDQGNLPAPPLRLLPVEPPLYLGYETVHEGPPPLPGQDGLSLTCQIPAEAVETEAGLSFLTRAGIPIPASLHGKLRHVSLPLNVSAKMLSQEGGPREQLVVSITAASPDGKRSEVFDRSGWHQVRDEEAEGEIRLYDRTALQEIPALMTDLPFVYDDYQKGFRCRITKNFAQKFSEWVSHLPEGCQFQAEDSQLRSILADPIRAKVRFEIEEGALDWFDLKVRLDVEHLDLSDRELKELIQAKGRHVRLANGHWMRLVLDLDPEKAETAASMGLDLTGPPGEKHRFHLLQLLESDLVEDTNPDIWRTMRERLERRRTEEEYPVPEGLNATLRPYQVEGFQFLTYLARNSFGGILADDMGLGKTIQSLAWILWLRKTHGDNPPPALVVCPKTVLDVWQSEAERFTPGLRVSVVRHPPGAGPTNAFSADIVVMNYALLRRHIETLRHQQWLAVILDEGQHIKNPDSLSAMAARALPAKNRLVLTGTPVENRLLDLWSLMQFAMPGILGDKSLFSRRFDRRKDDQAQERLTVRLRPFLLRRTKDQVLPDLPSRTEEDILCPMTRSQRKLYQTEIKSIQDKLLMSLGQPGFNTQIAVLQGLTRLRQICCDPRLIDPAQEEQASSKLTALVEQITELVEAGHKILVFSQFVTMLDLIRSRLQKDGIRHWYLTGQTKDRGMEVNNFNQHRGPGVFLLSLKAGGSGLNLTSASYVFLYDPWWNPAVENQAIDRTHRIGQSKPVFAYRLIARNSVEQKIRLLQERKKGMSDRLLGGTGFTRKLNEDDLKFLFSFEDE